MKKYDKKTGREIIEISVEEGYDIFGRKKCVAVGNYISGHFNEGEEAKDDASNEEINDDTNSDAEEEERKELDAAAQFLLQLQQEFMDGDIERSDVSDSEAQIIQASATGDIELRTQDDDGKTLTTYVCKNYSERSLEALEAICSNISTDVDYSFSDIDDLQLTIEDGLKYGKRLAKLITIRNEDRTLVNPGQRSGKVFKRHLHKIGNDNESIFYNILSENFEPVTMHISIDASGSMGSGRDSRFHKAMYMAVALAVVADSTTNVDVVISFRGQSRSGFSDYNFDPNISLNSTYYPLPFMLIAYDSRVDSILKIKKL